MSAFDDLVVSSHKRFESVAGPAGKLERFYRGSWWAAFQLDGPLPWKALGELRLQLEDLSEGAFGWPGGPHIPAIDQKANIISAWVPTDQLTNRYWQVSLTGFAYCRATFGEDVANISTVPPQVQPYVTLWRRQPLRSASQVLDHAASLAKSINIQMGWMGLKDRTLDDPESTPMEFQIGKAGDRPAKSNSLAYVADDPRAPIVHALASDLYQKFGYSATEENVAQWLRECKLKA